MYYVRVLTVLLYCARTALTVGSVTSSGLQKRSTDEVLVDFDLRNVFTKPSCGDTSYLLWRQSLVQDYKQEMNSAWERKLRRTQCVLILLLVAAIAWVVTH